MRRVVSFGEIMMRLSPPGRLRFVQAKELEVTFGGAEANTAVSLAQFGIESSFVTRLPSNPFADRALAELKGYGVDTDCVLRGGDRIGLYFLESGASQRPTVVIYDRAGSSMSQVAPGQFDWPRVFEGADWFHFTGITPALGPSVAAATHEACLAAKSLGLTVSCDLNYRQKLWSLTEAGETMSTLMKHVDVAILNQDQAVAVFGLDPSESDEAVARALASRFDLRDVALTIRDSRSADDHRWSAMLLSGDGVHRSSCYEIHAVDRVGGGDAFAAGLIYGFLNGEGPQRSLEFAVVASCLKHTIQGDYNLVSVSEVEALMAGDGSGRVQR